MSDIKARLDRLKAKIQTDDFLLGKGLSNEVNIWMFCYDPDEEMIVQHFIDNLVTAQDLKCNVRNCNLYKIFLSIC